jgi:hypothetical protein
MTRDLTIWTELSVTLEDGRVVRGWYRTYDGMVSVETTTATKTTQVGGSDWFGVNHATRVGGG